MVVLRLAKLGAAVFLPRGLLLRVASFVVVDAETGPRVGRAVLSLARREVLLAFAGPLCLGRIGARLVMSSHGLAETTRLAVG